MNCCYELLLRTPYSLLQQWDACSSGLLVITHKGLDIDPVVYYSSVSLHSIIEML